jgi:HNH endonuclease
LNPKIVKLVEERAGNYCEVCGNPALESMALHHRKLKSRGGKDSVSNLIRVHHKCHNLGTNSIHNNPEIATKNGWMVSSWSEPEIEPFLQPDGGWVILKDDGSIVRV